MNFAIYWISTHEHIYMPQKWNCTFSVSLSLKYFFCISCISAGEINALVFIMTRKSRKGFPCWYNNWLQLGRVRCYIFVDNYFWGFLCCANNYSSQKLSTITINRYILLACLVNNLPCLPAAICLPCSGCLCYPFPYLVTAFAYCQLWAANSTHLSIMGAAFLFCLCRLNNRHVYIKPSKDVIPKHTDWSLWCTLL